MVTFYFCGTCSGKRGGFQSAFEEEIRSNGSRCFALLRIQGQGEEELLMRSKEDEKLALFHVEQ
jgi:hypothetical protein